MKMIISKKERESLQEHIRQKRVDLLQGVDSKLVNDKHLGKKIVKDILSEVKRECGLIDECGRESSYHNLDRKYYEKAMRIIDEYVPHVALANEIDAEKRS